MSFSNSKQYNQSKNSSTSDRPSKVKRDEYTNQAENSTAFVKKAQKNQGEDYYGKSHQSNIENSQNNHKPARTKQYRINQEEAYNHQENSQKENKRSQKNNQQTYVPKGNQDQVQRSKESDIDHVQESRAENDSVRKSQNKKQGKGRKNRNQDQFGDVVYYVKKTVNENKQINEEEQKEGNSHKTIETSEKQEVIEKKGELEANNTQAQDLANHILSQLKLNDKFKTEGIKQSESTVKSASLLQNKQDNISQAVPKPIIEVPIPQSETQSVIENSQSLQDDKEEVSVISETETAHSRQACSIPHYPQPQVMSPGLSSPQMPASADQQRAMFAPGYSYSQIPMFQAPFIIFPQPNGTSFIQPLYQMPGMNMVPRRAEEEQDRFNQQPIYLVPSAMLPTMPIAENLQNNENKQNTDRMAGQFFPGYAINPHFMPYAQIHPGFIANTLIANPVTTQQVYANANVSSSEKETQKASLNDSQMKEECASDRRDD